MKVITITTVLILLFIVVGGAQEPQSEVADTVYTNGRIYTVNDTQPWAEAVAIKDGKFIVVGSAADVEAVRRDTSEVVDLGGAYAMTGIQENHIHSGTSGQTIDQVADKLSITEAMTPEEIQAALVVYADAHPGDGWITGQEWGTAHFLNGRAHKRLIDEVVPDRPVVLIDETNHNAVANAKALELAGITADTPQPATGVIHMDPKTGEPTGYLAEEIKPYEVIADRDQYRGRLVDPDHVKYVADGTPLRGTAIMLEPYANNPDSHGFWTLPMGYWGRSNPTHRSAAPLQTCLPAGLCCAYGHPNSLS